MAALSTGGLVVRVHAPGDGPVSYTEPPLTLITAADQPGAYAITYTAPDGSFSLSGLMPGDYRISVHEDVDRPALFVSAPIPVVEGKTAITAPIHLTP